MTDSAKLTLRLAREGAAWGFFLDRRAGVTRLSIPDQGGQADMLPRAPGQREWLIAHLAGLARSADVVETWPTVWDLRSPEAIEEVGRSLLAAGATVVRGRLEFHSSARDWAAELVEARAHSDTVIAAEREELPVALGAPERTCAALLVALQHEALLHAAIYYARRGPRSPFLARSLSRPWARGVVVPSVRFLLSEPRSMAAASTDAVTHSRCLELRAARESLRARSYDNRVNAMFAEQSREVAASSDDVLDVARLEWLLGFRRELSAMAEGSGSMIVEDVST